MSGALILFIMGLALCIWGIGAYIIHLYSKQRNTNDIKENSELKLKINTTPITEVQIRNVDPSPLWQSTTITGAYPYTFEHDNYQSNSSQTISNDITIKQSYTRMHHI